MVDRAQLIVWLDLPLATKLLRLARRTAGRIALREELWNGNRERILYYLKWDPEGLFVWTVRQHFRHRRHWPQRFAARRHVRLRSPRAVADWLATLADRADAQV